MTPQPRRTREPASTTSFFGHLLTVTIWMPLAFLLRLLRLSTPDLSTYGEWRAYQDNTDDLYSTQDWAHDDADTSYNYESLRGFKVELEACRRDGNMRALCSHLRYQSWTRNICNILSPRLYQKSKVRTKKLILDYLREVRRCVKLMAADNTGVRYPVMVSKQEKRELLRDMQSSLGKTTLLLQGGALVSMCHIGVVKALYREGLLPHIITGTGTGALIAALIGSTSPKDLMEVLSEARIDLGAFVRAKMARKNTEPNSWFPPRWWRDFLRRARRFTQSGHFFDINVLTECARDNLGDLTFEEAYAKSGRVLNITIAMPNVTGTPILLNYITAPHVLVWSAVAASVATSKQLYAPAHLFCKDDTGQVKRYFAVDATESRGKRVVVHPGSALERIGELFNVNHFIVSQTRPYVIPFIKIQERVDRIPLMGSLTRFVLSELLHWMYIARWLGVLPTPFQRIMIDETLPVTESWAKVVVCPQLALRDYFSVFEIPDDRRIQYFASKGEQCVWPRLCEIHVRCSVEFEVDAATQPT